jgi:outer membrane protein OmpA-like peptidoglycan-associated protein
MRATVAMLLLLVGGGAVAQIAEPAPPVMVFFDWGKTVIDRDYAAALDAEVTAFDQAAAGSVLVEGHSDRSGNSAANNRSSRVRADIVRDYLVAHGIPADRIRVHAWGEDRPLVATADGVREPQNRRVVVRIVSSDRR